MKTICTEWKTAGKDWWKTSVLLENFEFLTGSPSNPQHEEIFSIKDYFIWLVCWWWKRTPLPHRSSSAKHVENAARSGTAALRPAPTLTPPSFPPCQAYQTKPRHDSPPLTAAGPPGGGGRAGKAVGQRSGLAAGGGSRAGGCGRPAGTRGSADPALRCSPRPAPRRGRPWTRQSPFLLFCFCPSSVPLQ